MGLIEAVCKNDLELATSLLENGVDVNEKKNGATALLEATFNGNLKMVKLLLDHGADLNYANKHGVRALHLSSQKGFQDIARCLLEVDATQVNAKTDQGNSALILASFKGYDKIIRLLIHWGADINIRNDDGVAALHMASQEGYLHVTRLLLCWGADINSQTNEGSTPLILASSFFGDEKIVMLLMSWGADTLVTNNEGKTAEDLAILHRHSGVLKILQNKELLQKKQPSLIFTSKLLHDDDRMEKMKQIGLVDSMTMSEALAEEINGEDVAEEDDPVANSSFSCKPGESDSNMNISLKITESSPENDHDKDDDENASIVSKRFSSNKPMSCFSRLAPSIEISKNSNQTLIDIEARAIQGKPLLNKSGGIIGRVQELSNQLGVDNGEGLGLKQQVEIMEGILFGSFQNGPLSARVKVLEEELGI